MASYKLQYFDGRGRGELSRMCFAAAGKKFEDVRIDFADWPKVKAETPQGSMPVLTVGDVKLCQSMSIVRYLAREFGLYGKSNLDMAYVDMILDTLLDLFTPFVTAAFEKDEAVKAEKMKTFKEDTLPKVTGFLEDIVKKTKSKSGCAIGDKMSVADLALHVYLESVGCTDAKSGCPPLLAAIREKVASDPNVKKYLSTRKETPF